MFEQAVGFPRTRDVWRRLRFIVDQARAWSDSEHGSLRAYLAWATRQGSDTARVAEAALPETDADTLKIMTIHSAKGLEFPMVIVSGMTTRIVRAASGLQVLWPRGGGFELKMHSNPRSPIPAWPRARATSSWRPGTRADTAPRSAGPCTACCRPSIWSPATA
jgi:ATP-dependent exoDNAse (exonuclease V) beta subunit